MSDELKRRMELEQRDIMPPYQQNSQVGNVIFPGYSSTTCNMVVDDVWKTAWEAARRVVDEWWGDAPRERDRLQEPVTGENTLRPDIQYHMDDEVEIIHECYQNLMRLDEKARKRALYYLHERIIGLSDE